MTTSAAALDQGALRADPRPLPAAPAHRGAASPLLVAGPSLALGLLVGSDFMPQLDEGAFLLQTVLPTEASLDEVDRLNHRVEDILREVPEVEDVVRRTGRAERTEDPMPHTLSDVLVTLKADRARDLGGDRRRHARAAGTTCRASPCCSRRRSGMRIDEGLGGTPADISVRVFGPDLEELATAGGGGRAHHGEGRRA